MKPVIPSLTALLTAPIHSVLAFACLIAPGCVVYTDPPHREPNYAPELTYADAGCYWDYNYGDYVWYFDADATDPNGAGDVVAVYADVYDDYTGEWIDGFDLVWEGGITWYSAWVGSTTYLDCTVPMYVVDINAVDRGDLADVVTVAPFQEL